MNSIRDKKAYNMSAIILAGGTSSRMGFDKAFMMIDGMTLIERQIELLYDMFKEIIIVANNRQKSGLLYKTIDKNRLDKTRIIQDMNLGRGPLRGIYSGLAASGAFYNFILACDMPYIHTGLIEYMYIKSHGYDAVVPEINNRYEPLHSFYSKNCLKPIKQLLDREVFRVNSLFSCIKVKKVTEAEIGQFISKVEIFTNINTRQELADMYAYRQV